MNQVKHIFYFAASAVFLALLSGCTSTTATPTTPLSSANTECMKEGMSAPIWTCKPEVADVYASVGVAQINGADKTQAVKAALYNGRTEIAKQVQSQVREKLNNFARTPEGSNKEKVDNLYTSIANAVKPEDLYLQERLQSWTTPSGKVYIHVIAPKSSLDVELKKAVKSSYINDQVTWLDFNSKQVIAKLEKEFDVILPKLESVKVATLFQTESVSDMIVGSNRKH